MRLLEAVVAGGIVIVWAHRLGDAPMCNGQLGIQFGGTLEGTSRFVMIKGKDQPQPLVEKLLRFGVAGGHRMVKIPKS